VSSFLSKNKVSIVRRKDGITLKLHPRLTDPTYSSKNLLMTILYATVTTCQEQTLTDAMSVGETCPSLRQRVTKLHFERSKHPLAKLRYHLVHYWFIQAMAKRDLARFALLHDPFVDEDLATGQWIPKNDSSQKPNTTSVFTERLTDDQTIPAAVYDATVKQTEEESARITPPFPFDLDGDELLASLPTHC
jgi:hypothetical protein